MEWNWKLGENRNTLPSWVKIEYLFHFSISKASWDEFSFFKN